MSRRILVVEDEAPIRDMLCFVLEQNGYQASVAESFEAAINNLVEPYPDLVLLDWMLPGGSGIQIAKKMKQHDLTRNIPIIMITARGEEEDKVRGLEVGADDYVTKPFSPKELMARIKAVIRRVAPTSLDDVIEYCDEDYEEGTGVLRYSEKIDKITVREALELSLTYSDNIANNMLNRVCGYDINSYISCLTGEDITVGNLTTAKEQEKIYYKLYSDEKYSLIIDLIKKSYCHDRIDKYLEPEKVAHKFGNYYRYFHDVGIVYDDKPYILVVLTKDIGNLSENLEGGLCEDERPLIDGGEEAKELIAKISKIINIYNIIKAKNMVK